MVKMGKQIGTKSKHAALTDGGTSLTLTNGFSGMTQIEELAETGVLIFASVCWQNGFGVYLTTGNSYETRFSRCARARA